MAQLRASLQDRPTATVADLIALGEGEHLEFKASARAPLRDGEPGQSMVIMVVKAVAGFYNGKGGTLLIGVQDGGTVSGLSADYLLFPRNQRNKDQYELWLRNTLGNFISKLVGPHLDVAFEIIQDRQICRVDVRPGPEPAYVQEGNVKDIFYVRQGNQTVKLSLSDAITYIRHRWPSLGPVAASGK